ncbi:MAG: TIGR04086 family membrane protein [Clostridia bacterium]|nr:TIGR04086 family membrane protein [Clostridia bacterium]
MAQAKTYKRRSGRKASSGWTKVLKGLGIAVLATGVMVLVFSLLMQWLKPSDQVIRIVNQVIKLASILIGCWVCVGRAGENGLIRGACVGLLYMGAGVAVYGLLTGQQASLTAYLADLGMGIAGGGIAGMILSNLAPKAKS